MNNANSNDIWPDIKCLYRNSSGQIHCDSGPAIIYADGDQEYYQNGWLHRADGPAVMYGDYFEWWINGNNFTDEINGWMTENNLTYPFLENTLRLFQMRWL